jgi:hypothetical protein
MMDLIRTLWILTLIGVLCLLILSGCITFTVTNDEGITDAEITVQPTQEAIQDTINSGEIEPGVQVGISVPISLTEEN